MDSSLSSSYLILFDVNGLMCTKISAEDSSKVNPEDCLRINPYYYIIIRPGIKEAILSLSKRYCIGIYSSTTSHNLVKINDAIFGESSDLFIFVADRHLTQLDPRYGKDPSIKEYDTIKLLDCIWKHPIYNSKRKWNSSNTLLIDHDYRKIEFNPPDNILVVPEFTLETYLDDQNSTETLLTAIRSRIRIIEN
jgi:hypothetical protein